MLSLMRLAAVLVIVAALNRLSRLEGRCVKIFSVMWELQFAHYGQWYWSLVLVEGS